MQEVPVSVAPVERGRRSRRRAAAPRDALGLPASVTPVRTPRWIRRYGLLLVAVDATVIGLAGLVAIAIDDIRDATLRGIGYPTLVAALVPVWLAMLAAGRAYEPRFVGVGSEEFRRVFDASVRLLAVVATAAFAFALPLSRSLVGLVFPMGTLLLLVGRYATRKVLHQLRKAGRASHRVLAVGARDAVEDLVREARRAPYAGFLVVAACVPDPEVPLAVEGAEVPVVGVPVDAAERVSQCRADTVAVAGGWAMGADGVRRLSWQLEGTNVDLVVAPSLTNVAGPRISIRPVAGLPLLHVEEPEFTGARRVFKGVFDRTMSALILLAALPVMAVVAIAIKATSPGPVFFKQQRVGQNGREFTLWKFRSMRPDAEAVREQLLDSNEHDGVLFKIKRDPRVTSVGRILRRLSLDELPQILNVVRGDMSLVGPRPPLPEEVAAYRSDVRRRLLVKPGLTGLWQVSGRSDLTWEESVRLDLHYVENWSVALDAMILWKTVGAVLRGRGAY
ncbi:MAG TPA: sugar transferase [Frankiaceae bacterium]|jgi:exopolysaccharide biosynthesis polyprenyl glycosylphosphotransferase|nr:sugar transferase [Frankiaceae bacterium]